MNELSLFTGAGGGLLGTMLLGWRCVGAVEFSDYPVKVLEARQRDGILDDFPIWHMDIRHFNARIAPAYTGLVDVITAGFPCQPFSLAGKQAGADDPRNMWPATIAAIRTVRPRFAFLENVPGLLNSGYFGTIVNDLAEAGTVVDGVCYRLPSWERRIGVIGSGLLPTARANESTESIETTAKRQARGTKTSKNLTQAARGNWPTPTTRDWKDGTAQSVANVPTNSLLGRAVHDPKYWPTPQAADANRKGADYARANRPNSGGDDLNTAISRTGEHGGRLNPTWVEWLMGWPLGWTDLKPLAMDKFRQWWRQHGGY